MGKRTEDVVTRQKRTGENTLPKSQVWGFRHVSLRIITGVSGVPLSISFPAKLLSPEEVLILVLGEWRAGAELILAEVSVSSTTSVKIELA